MDFYQFVNSPDVREHLRKIRYEFSPAEAAWFVYQSRTATLKEKHEAWQTIIDTMPDSAIEIGHGDKQSSLHIFLRSCMQKQNELADALFRSEQRIVYQARVRDAESRRWYDCDGVFPTCKACCSAAAAEEAIDRIRIRRLSPYDAAIDIVAELRPDGELLSVEENRPSDAETDYSYIFENMWFCFPTPFQPGDIVHDPEQRGYCGGPFVLTGTTEDYCREHPDYRGCDSSDMNAWGYFQNEDSGEIYYECMENYMDCEYYRGDLGGKRRVLTAMSNFLKGNIDVSLFARAYHQILLEEAAKDSRPRDITDEGLRLAGLPEGEQ